MILTYLKVQTAILTLVVLLLEERENSNLTFSQILTWGRSIEEDEEMRKTISQLLKEHPLSNFPRESHRIQKILAELIKSKPLPHKTVK